MSRPELTLTREVGTSWGSASGWYNNTLLRVAPRHFFLKSPVMKPMASLGVPQILTLNGDLVKRLDFRDDS